MSLSASKAVAEDMDAEVLSTGGRRLELDCWWCLSVEADECKGVVIYSVELLLERVDLGLTVMSL